MNRKKPDWHLCSICLVNVTDAIVLLSFASELLKRGGDIDFRQGEHELHIVANEKKLKLGCSESLYYFGRESDSVNNYMFCHRNLFDLLDMVIEEIDLDLSYFTGTMKKLLASNFTPKLLMEGDVPRFIEMSKNQFGAPEQSIKTSCSPRTCCAKADRLPPLGVEFFGMEDKPITNIYYQVSFGFDNVDQIEGILGRPIETIPFVDKDAFLRRVYMMFVKLNAEFDRILSVA